MLVDRRALALGVLVSLAGVAALSWEVLWQLEASLALGISAKGTALTLATTMVGMALGSWTMGAALQRTTLRRPLRVYAALECVVGLTGVSLLVPGLRFVASVDANVFAAHPDLASLLHVTGVACVIGPPAIAMGATIPIIGLAARRVGARPSTFYALNTAGACVGVFAASFGLLPYLGVELAAIALAGVNVVVGAGAFALGREGERERERERECEREREREGWRPLVVVGASGVATFALEVIWFRALRAAFQATTHGFAVMLAAVLVALAAGARLASWIESSWIEKKKLGIGAVLAAAGVATVLATPLLERFDQLAVSTTGLGAGTRTLVWLFAALGAIGPGMVLLGTCLPWVLDRQVEPSAWGRVYAANTVAAVIGSLAGAWVLLPSLGVARSAWLVGGVVSAVGWMLLERRRPRTVAVAAGVAAIAIAIVTESGVGRKRVMGNLGAVARVVAFEEGPDSTVAVAEGESGARVLLIDGFGAAFGGTAGSHYMAWMGRLPMLLHPAPRRALVICFGTGQTANAVRREGPEALDIVDVSPAVFRMAPHFAENERVLEDPRVHHVVMDGRAWLRRTDRRYDVITLEPMPPNFAGVNALYALEFYETAALRLHDGGLLAQWVPFHILSVHDASAIAATFQKVFPDSLLWLDPLGATGILVGRKGARPRGEVALGSDWPGFAREGISRDLSPDVVRRHVILGTAGMAAYAALGPVVTDDNQLLAYGPRRYRFFERDPGLDAANLVVLDAIASRFPPRP